MPPRKTPERRQGRGTTDAVIGPKRITEVPKLPAPHGGGLLPTTRAAWKRFWSDELLAPMVRDADMAALVRLFYLYDERDRADRLYRSAREVEGSTGQLVVNPFYKAAASMDARILKLEERFGITPKARLQLGIAMGAAVKSLEEINRGFDEDLDGDDEEDPRRAAIDTTGTERR